jgi:SNF2 family DNA or RNA helicase
MQIVEDKAIVLRTRSPDKYSVIPRSKVVREVSPGLHEVAVYFGLDEARVLRNLGVKDVPSPITVRYDWPGRYKPFAHQKDTASFLTLYRRAFVFSEPGTGKTLSALWAADYLMKRGEVRRVLILCPLSIMQSAWMRDIGNSVIHRTAVVAHHTKATRRIELLQNNYEFVIVNYDGLNLITNEINADGRFDLVIVDEANHYKNVNTQRWKALNKILKPNTFLWLMTGTPAAQSPLDAYGLAKLVNPAGVPKFFTAWRDKVMHKLTHFKWGPKETAYADVFNALQPAIRYTKAECLDLPPVITVTREVALTAQQMKYYKLLKERMLIDAAGETITAVNAAAGVNKLLQISAGAAYTDTKEVIEFDCGPRLSVLMEVINETDRKVIVFVPYRHSIDTISAHLSANNIANEQIHGDISATKRGQIFKRFQETPDPRVLVIQPQAAAHGVTLTAADTVVFWGPVMSVDTYLQCCARADRVGQDSTKVLVVHIQGSEIERRMFAKLQGRVEEHSLLVDLYKEELDAK